MNIFITVRNKIIHKIHVKKRAKYLLQNWNYDANNLTILSNNCIGGFIYKNLGVPYQSPTTFVNILPLDFIKLALNPKYYFSKGLVEAEPFQDEFNLLHGWKIDFPCAYLEKLKIMFQHEKIFEEAKNKWDRRVLRVNYNNIIIIMFVEKQLMTKEVLKRFALIRFPKILLSNNPIIANKKDCFYVDVPIEKDWWQTKNGIIRYFETFDFKSFFDANKIPKKQKKKPKYIKL